jgi:hypothetical protein
MGKGKSDGNGDGEKRGFLPLFEKRGIGRGAGEERESEERGR